MRYENETFEGKTVDLDGNDFVNCSIQRCTLVYRGGALPGLYGTTSVQNCTFDLQEAADRTVTFLRTLRNLQGEKILKDLFQIA